MMSSEFHPMHQTSPSVAARNLQVPAALAWRIVKSESAIIERPSCELEPNVLSISALSISRYTTTHNPNQPLADL